DGTLTINNSTISGNTAGDGPGGGIYSVSGTLAITSSTISGNSAADDGGGLYNVYATVTITSSTISANSASKTGGGVDNEISASGTVNLRNTIIAKNTAIAGP